ncbi:hypothetical protein L3Q82_012093 [Scortum barcoo]|uniref:Uncharacterized protein n=1 Tax=Scortum barcoo TaxID=214431 RepID=A0ACB8W6K1_9TELE|nr:hypothetical protein L3Q82_012093 [Scortum barcoo]
MFEPVTKDKDVLYTFPLSTYLVISKAQTYDNGSMDDLTITEEERGETDKLILKLHNLGLPSSLCHWIRDFLTNRPQVVRIGDNTSSTLVLSTGTPQGCVLSPALFTLFTSDCSAIHSTNTIVKFADDTTIVGPHIRTMMRPTTERRSSTLLSVMQPAKESPIIQYDREKLLQIRSVVEKTFSSPPPPAYNGESPWRSHELRSRMAFQRDIKNCNVLVFTETWLDPSIPDSAIVPKGLSIHRQDRTINSGKSKGGGVCFMVNNKWCSDVEIISMGCSPDLEHLMIRCRPYYLPHEFTSVVMTAVYVPPHADNNKAMDELYGVIDRTETSRPEAALPVPTRGENTLDHVYTPYADTYKLLPRSPFGKSDHASVLLLPSYRQKLKHDGPVTRTIQQWSDQSDFGSAMRLLQHYDRRTFPNQKPWVNGEVRAKLKARTDSDLEEYRKSRYALRRAISSAKRQYRDKVESHYKGSNTRSMWAGLKTLTDYKKKISSAEVMSASLPDELNTFYARFESTSPAVEVQKAQEDHCPPVITRADVCRTLKRINTRKAPGPDGIPGRALKETTIVPVPKKTKILSLNDDRPVALTSTIMKCFERSTEDAIALTLHTALPHLDQRDTYGRPQAVRMGSTTSSTLTLNTGAPQGCVLSPRLYYSLFTHDCVATHSSNTIIKFADDTTVIGLITGDDETAYREVRVRALTSWCQDNNLHLNVSKTKELIVDFRRRQREEHAPLSINGTTVERVSSFRFLGVHISEDLTWTHHTDFITKSARQRLFFLRRLRRLNMDSRILCSFYSIVRRAWHLRISLPMIADVIVIIHGEAVERVNNIKFLGIHITSDLSLVHEHSSSWATIESILCLSAAVWYGRYGTRQDQMDLARVVKTAQGIVGSPLPDLDSIYAGRIQKKARHVAADPTHPGLFCFPLENASDEPREIVSESRAKESHEEQSSDAESTTLHLTEKAMVCRELSKHQRDLIVQGISQEKGFSGVHEHYICDSLSRHISIKSWKKNNITHLAAVRVAHSLGLLFPYKSFMLYLTGRPQYVRLGDCRSDTVASSTGAPQGNCALSGPVHPVHVRLSVQERTEPPVLPQKAGVLQHGKKLLQIFYQSVVASALLYAVVCWGSLKKKDAERLDKLIRCDVISDFHKCCFCAMLFCLCTIQLPSTALSSQEHRKVICARPAGTARENRSTEDAVSIALHTALTHLQLPNTYVRMLFVDFSSAFNTVIPDKLILKLHNPGTCSSSLCHWIRDFLTNRPQVFADDTTIVGLISDNDETHYREEIQHLTQWCSNNNLVLNTSKTKEVIVDYRRSRRTEHAPLLIHGEAVKQCDGMMDKGVLEPVGPALGKEQSFTEQAPLVADDGVQRVAGIVHNIQEFVQSPRLCHRHQRVQLVVPTTEPARLISLSSLDVSFLDMLPPQHTTV